MAAAASRDAAMRARIAPALLLVAGLCGCAPDPGSLLTVKTVLDRGLEARSGEDIMADTQLFIRVNRVMAGLGVTSAATEIYERRLLITGQVADKETCDRFRRSAHRLHARVVYWHVLCPGEDGAPPKTELDWVEVNTLRAKANARLAATGGVADLNFRVAADAEGTLYLLGRARSPEEKQRALASAAEGDGVGKVVDYVVVRP